MDILADLNPAQREAVQAIEGPLLILAGPGSGKTRVITHRIAYLIREVGVAPYNVVAVTFTNKAAREMRGRLDRLLGQHTKGLTVGTFHATCARYLRRDIEHLGRDRSFVIYDADDQVSLVKQVLKDLQLDDKQYRPRSLLGRISRAKSEMVGPKEFAARTQSYWEEVCARVYERYQRLLRERNALDFDDLLLTTVQLYREHPDVLARTQNRTVHLQVDEFQDTNLVQYELVKLWGGKYRNVCVVGDEDQGIYSWRNADIANIQRRFRQDFPERHEIILTRNYRSTRTILDAAQAVIARNLDRTDKQLVTEKGAGPAITVYEAYDEREEADYVALEIARLRREGRIDWGGAAVMYRTNAQSRALEDAFMRRGIPYKLVGGTRFYLRREVKDILAYLRLAHNPADEGALARIINVPRRGIGQRTLDELIRWSRRLNVGSYTALRVLKTAQDKDTEDEELARLATGDVPLSRRATRPLLDFLRLVEELVDGARRLTVPELLDLVLERTAYSEYIRDGTEEGETRWENVQELRTVTAEYAAVSPGESLVAFLEDVALVSDVDDLEEQPQAVTLLTLHTAKGLEFPAVFIVGLEERLFPHSRSMDDPAQLAEERRLCYVGMTRAKEYLYLLHAFRRTLYGNSVVNEASRFLADVPPALLAGRKVHMEERPLSRPSSPAMAGIARHTRLGQPATPPTQPASLTYKAGDRVRHEKFGEGTVVSSELTRDDEQVTVAFVGAGVKKLLVSYAPMEKVIL